MTLPDIDDGKRKSHSNMQGMLTSSRIFLSRCVATIKAKTTCGPVLNVHVSKLCGVHSFEVQIESLGSQGHTSWILICRGLERFVEELVAHL